METDFFTTYAISAAFGIGLLSVVLSALSLYYKDEKVPDRAKRWLLKIVPTMTLMGLLAIVLVVTDCFFSGRCVVSLNERNFHRPLT